MHTSSGLCNIWLFDQTSSTEGFSTAAAVFCAAIPGTPEWALTVQQSPKAAWALRSQHHRRTTGPLENCSSCINSCEWRMRNEVFCLVLFFFPQWRNMLRAVAAIFLFFLFYYTLSSIFLLSSISMLVFTLTLWIGDFVATKSNFHLWLIMWLSLILRIDKLDCKISGSQEYMQSWFCAICFI